MEFKQLLNSDKIVLGTWSQIAAPEIVDLIGLNGFSFSIIDCQHAPIGIEAAERLSRACRANGLAPLVRVPSGDAVGIMQMLDAGIPHVVVPDVSSKSDAETIVAATRYGPAGLRGACPCVGSAGHFTRDWMAYVAEEEARVGAIALVETEQGVENFSEIASVEDLTAIMIGPFDLAVSMGQNGNWRAKEVSDAVAEMINMAVAKGQKVIMPVFSSDPGECRELVDEYQTMGVTTFVVGTDKILIADAFEKWTSQLR